MVVKKDSFSNHILIHGTFNGEYKFLLCAHFKELHALVHNALV
jgi:hypothetical protein